MFERVIELTSEDNIFIRNCDENVGCGNINNDGHLYYINTYERKAYQLPDKYKDTPIMICPDVGGLSENMIMVSLLGEIELQYYHNLSGAAGMWGWLDMDGKEVIPPQYIYAENFYEGKARVCKGQWEVDENGRYWCENEKWGLIDTFNEECIPCIFDEIYDIEESDRYYLCHIGGWETGKQVVYDAENRCEVLELDGYFDGGYMFNSCYIEDDLLIFDNHIPGEEKDYVSVYSLKDNEWVVKNKEVEDTEFMGETKITVEKDGKEIIIY